MQSLRARLVSDPKEYRWSDYGEAVGGLAKARTGLARAAWEEASGQQTKEELAWKFSQQATANWKAVQARYRLILYAVGQVPKVKGGRAQGVISEEAGETAKAAAGELSWAVALRDRVRYFSRSGVLGTREFVDRIFGLKRDRFPEGRKDGARKLRGAVDWGSLRSLRDLRG